MNKPAPTNGFNALLQLVGRAPLQVGTVTASSGGSVRLTLLGGGDITARGAGAVGARVFVRDGLVEGPAPDLPTVSIEV